MYPFTKKIQSFPKRISGNLISFSLLGEYVVHILIFGCYPCYLRFHNRKTTENLRKMSHFSPGPPPRRKLVIFQKCKNTVQHQYTYVYITLQKVCKISEKIFGQNMTLFTRGAQDGTHTHFW